MLVQTPHKSTSLGPIQDLYTQDDTVKHVSHIYSFVSIEHSTYPSSFTSRLLTLNCRSVQGKIKIHHMSAQTPIEGACAAMYASSAIWTLYISVCRGPDLSQKGYN